MWIKKAKTHFYQLTSLDGNVSSQCFHLHIPVYLYIYIQQKALNTLDIIQRENA